VLDWIESFSIAVWLRESPSVWAHPTVLTLHTTGMAVLVGAAYVLDLRLLGIGRNVPLSSYRWIFPVVAIGLTVNLCTGLLLFMKNATSWGTALPFFIKMLLVITSVATLVPLRKFVLKGDVSESEAARARMMAIVSILAWSGAVTAGRLLAYLVVT
jgi:hypothetical protein